MAEKNFVSDMMDEFKTVLLERFGNPFIFSWFLAWSFVNYKFYLILFANTSLNYKLTLLNWYFSPVDWYYFTHIWLIPFLSASFYVFVYPYINRKILKIVLNHKLNELKDKALMEKKAIFTYDDIEMIYFRHGEEISRLNKDIKRLKDSEEQIVIQKNALESLVQSLQQSHASIPTEEDVTKGKSIGELTILNREKMSKMNDRITQNPELPSGFKLSLPEMVILNTIAKNESFEDESIESGDLFKSSGLPAVEARLGTQLLENKNYIVRHYQADENFTVYVLTSSGREAYYQLLDSSRL